MKHSNLFILILCMIGLNISNAQEASDATGFDGDNFSLEGALEVFKNSESMEDFEKNLNQEDNYVNNLDLNGDGDIDYIRVIDNQDGDIHAIVLQVPVSENENQDIAVIEIEKTGDSNAVLQIIGDEDVYGEQTIVEPFDVEASDDDSGPSADMEFRKIVINVWLWPSVRYIYRPSYRVWVSPWRWSYYPKYWSPWRPRAYHVFRPYKIRHHKHYHVVNTHRVVKAHRVYTPKRKTSKTVVSRTKVTRTKVGTTKRGKKVSTSTTTSKTKVKNNKGVKASKTKKVKTKSGASGTKKTKTKTKKKKG